MPQKKLQIKKKKSSSNGKVKVQLRTKTQPLRLPSSAIDMCLKEWLNVFAAPFNSTKPVCLPFPPSPPSQKTRTELRGTLTVGGAGVGMLMVQITAANDTTPAVYYSNSGTYTSNVFATATGVASLLNTQSDHASASFSTTGLRSRCVLAAARVKYLGTENNRGGRICPIVFPSHKSVAGLGISDILALQGYSSEPVDQKWHSIRWFPQLSHETDYQPTPLVWGDGLVSTSGDMGILVESTVAGTFEFEVVFYHEIIGPTNNLSNSKASANAGVAAGSLNDMGARNSRTGNILPAVEQVVGGGVMGNAIIRGAANGVAAIRSRLVGVVGESAVAAGEEGMFMLATAA